MISVMSLQKYLQLTKFAEVACFDQQSISGTLHTLSCLLWRENGKMGNKNLQKNLYSGALQYEGNLNRRNSAQVRFISFNLGVYNANSFMWTLWLCSHHSQQTSSPYTQSDADPSLSTLGIYGFTQLLKCKDLVSTKPLATVASPDLCGCPVV